LTVVKVRRNVADRDVDNTTAKGEQAMTTGERIRAAREAACITQEELASLLRCSRAGVANWERDRTTPLKALRKPLCKALSVKYAEIFGAKP